MTFYGSTIFFVKGRYFLWAVQKRQILVFQNEFVRGFSFVFFHKSQKMSFIREFFYDNIKCHDVHPKFY